MADNPNPDKPQIVEGDNFMFVHPPGSDVPSISLRAVERERSEALPGWGDLDVLRETIDMASRAVNWERSPYLLPAEDKQPHPTLQAARAIVDRIAALLPPREAG